MEEHRADGHSYSLSCLAEAPDALRPLTELFRLCFGGYDGALNISVSYTHLTLPTNREV